jgi:hypothetical protein
MIELLLQTYRSRVTLQMQRRRDDQSPVDQALGACGASC